jgi:curved DNA-binding protein CbpA
MSSNRDFRDLDGADPWTLLGVRRDADADEIRRSYRRLSRSHHTDVGGDASQQARLNRAYEVLSDPGRRADYAGLLDGKTQQPTAPRTDFADPEPDPDEPVADPFEWSTGPIYTQRPPSQPYTQDPYVAPEYQQPQYQQPYDDGPAQQYQNPNPAPPYQDPYVAPPYRGPYQESRGRRTKRGVNAKAIASLPTALLCMPVSIILAIQALRQLRWSGERGKTLAWIALILDAFAIAYFVGAFR